MVVYCSIPDCQSNSNNVTLFQIPPPTEEYKAIGIKWIQLILNSYPNFSLVNIYDQYVCSKHFKDQHFIPPDKLSLKSFAIPTVFDSGRNIYVDIYRRQINNTALGMNTVHDIPVLRNNNVHTNAVDYAQVLSVPNPSYNTIETRPTTRNVFYHTPSIQHDGLQEPSEQTAAASSRPLRTRKRRIECDFCNTIDSKAYKIRIKRI